MNLDFLSSIKIDCICGTLISGTTVCGVNIVENGVCLQNKYICKTTGLTGATNGLSISSQKVKLGGTLSECTHIEGAQCFDIDAVRGFNVRTSGNTDINIDSQNCGGFLLKSQCGSIDTFPDFTSAVGFYGNIDQPSGFAIYDCRAIATGIVYNADYSANYVSRSLVDKAYVDSVATGLNVHTAVIVATTGPITLSGNQTIDGILTTTGMRVLVKNQSSGATNGIYSANTSTWGRTLDYDGTPSGEVVNGDLIPVTSGTTQNSSIWALTSQNPIVVGVTPLTFSEFSTVLDIGAGNGINVTQAGGTHNISVQLASNCGLTFCGTGLAVNPNIAGSCLSYSSGVLNVCSSCFLAVGGTAVCATTAGNALALCGCVPASFLLSGGTAKNSLCLGGNLANTYAPLATPSFTTCICTPIIKLTAVAAKGSETAMAYVNSAGCITSGATPSSGIGWSNATNGSTVAGCGTVASSSTICNNTFYGIQAGCSITTGKCNVAIGTCAFTKNTIGCSNIAIGICALYINTGGTCNIAIGGTALVSNTCGNQNIAIGGAALISNVYGCDNVGIGQGALCQNTCGCSNIAIGLSALQGNKSGLGNIAFGVSTLTNNTTGNYNFAAIGAAMGANTVGANNIAIGQQALYANTGGTNSIAFGCLALASSKCSIWNIAIGTCALYNHTTGYNNVAIGQCALLKNTTAGYNIAIGVCALGCNTTTVNNIAIGQGTLYYNTGGTCNIAIGPTALYCACSGNDNVGIGNGALVSNKGSGGCNIAIGKSGLYNNTTGHDNIAIGQSVMYINNVGFNNIGIGQMSLCKNTTGCFNTAMGQCALFANTTGLNNIGIGAAVLLANTKGSCNTAIGSSVLNVNISGGTNVAIGLCVLAANTCGHCNLALGYNTLQANTNGCENIGIGISAGYSNIVGCQNIIIGCAALYNSTGSRNLAIGNGSGYGLDASDKFYLGNCYSCNLLCGDFVAKTLLVCSILCASSCIKSPVISATTLCGGTINGTATCATTAGNALALCSCVPSCFLGATATASNSLALCGCTPACFLGATATATCATTAGNALALCACTPNCFLGATATASNSSALCGCTPACFLGVSAIAANTQFMCICDNSTRSANDYSPNSNGHSMHMNFVSSGSVGTGGNYAGLMTITPYDGNTASTGDASYQLVFGGTAVNGGGTPWLRIRKGIDTTWNAFYDIITSANISTQSVAVASCLSGYGAGAAGYATCAGCANAVNAVSGNEVTLGCGFAGGVLYLAYRGSSGAITSYRMSNGIADGGLACVCAIDYIATSDCRIKTCICPISNALSTVLNLQGINYQLCCDETHTNHIGLIAQDTIKILPEVVTIGTPDDKDTQFGITDGKMGITYDKLTAVLIEAIKELDKKVNCLCCEVNYLRNSNYKS